jgi:glutathione-regulated potassium-efflux system ancillary protein KefG
MAKILVLFAHPALEKSRMHARLLHHIQKLKGVTVNDLYEEYPDFDVDIKREQQLLHEHDVIVWQHPFYWYSAPALIKQWIDLVLEHGWAYGPGGVALQNKYIFNAISSGGSKQAYRTESLHRPTIRQYLAPFEQTAKLCRMHYLPPFIIHGTHKLSEAQMDAYAVDYAALLQYFQQDRLSNENLQAYCLNDLLSSLQTEKS